MNENDAGNKRIIGSEKETIAAEYLKSAGLVILERNYRVRSGEIDIIAKDGECLVFCEVKYRSSNKAGGASFAVSRQKQLQIARVANIYMTKKHISPDTFCRFDCVLIDSDKINHIKNAWQL